MGESALGTLAGLQFAAAIPDPILPAELTWYLAMTEQIVPEVPVIAGGVFTLPDCASLASQMDWAALERRSH
jgi:L-alanine-DL-glutamate epimerase-like enolase superfamily enzyme